MRKTKEGNEITLFAKLKAKLTLLQIRFHKSDVLNLNAHVLQSFMSIQVNKHKCNHSKVCILQKYTQECAHTSGTWCYWFYLCISHSAHPEMTKTIQYLLFSVSFIPTEQSYIKSQFEAGLNKVKAQKLYTQHSESNRHTPVYVSSPVFLY